MSDSFDGLVKPWGQRIPMWVGLGAAGAGPARSPRETVEVSWDSPRGKGFTVFTKASCARLRELGVHPSCLSFLDSGIFNGLFSVAGTRIGSGFSSRGGSQGSRRCSGAVGLLVLGEGRGRCCSRLLLRMCGGLRAGSSACAVTWTSGARAGSSAGADTRCANRTE